MVSYLISAASLRNKNFRVYFDNYFTSPMLFKWLSANGCYGCGTIRKKRAGLPKFDPAILKKLKRGEHRTNFEIHYFVVKHNEAVPDAVAMQCNDPDMVFYAWLDKKPVLVLDCTAIPCMTTTCIRSGNEISVPEGVHNYHKHMGGVDRNDQLCSFYKFSHKSRRWWVPAFLHLFEVAITNLSLIWRHFHPENWTEKKFRLDLAKLLLSWHVGRKRHGPEPTTDRFFARHFPQSRPQRLCVNCRKSRPKTGCEQCNVNLCSVDCFQSYHTA